MSLSRKCKPTIIFDENGDMSGCNYIEPKNLEIDWSERQTYRRKLQKSQV